jgi:hypothetical protein
VSRGGEKLAGALDAFDLDVTGLRVLDAGASTGGFTDCLVQAGADHVVAVDVGHGQLHPRLRDHPRVTVIERCNVRHLTPDQIGGTVDLVVADLSFISLTAVVPALVGACRPGGRLVLLVKPQFEAGRREVSKGRGVITDPDLHREACDRVAGEPGRGRCGAARARGVAAHRRRRQPRVPPPGRGARMSDVLVVAHRQRADAVVLAQQTIAWLRDHGHRAVMIDEDAVALEVEVGRHEIGERSGPRRQPGR